MTDLEQRHERRSAAARLSGPAALLLAVSGCTVGTLGGQAPEGAVELKGAPGDTLVVGGLSITAPQRGEGLWTEVMHDDGSTTTVQIETLFDGMVIQWPEVLGDEGHDGTISDNASEASAASSASPCTDVAYKLGSFTWKTPFKWSFYGGSTPKNVNRKAAEKRLKWAATNITRSDNDCGYNDQVSAKHVYLGRKPIGASVKYDGTCKAADGHNAVSFGNLPAGVLGVACVHYSGDEAVEGDIKFNKADHAFIAKIGNGCTNRYSIEAVATHEFGHVFGLGHVSESGHGNLTMSTAINGPCQNSEASLGRGDVRGLREAY